MVLMVRATPINAGLVSNTPPLARNRQFVFPRVRTPNVHLPVVANRDGPVNTSCAKLPVVATLSQEALAGL